MTKLRPKAREYLEDLLRQLSLCENITATLGPQMAIVAAADAYRAIGLLSEEESIEWSHRARNCMDALRESLRKS